MNRDGNLIFRLALAAAACAGLGILASYNYLLFHVLAEFFSIGIGIAVTTITWNSRHYLQNGYLLLLGFASVFVAVIDLLHTVAYKGMGVFPGNDANLATQLWVAARIVQSLAVVFAPLFLRLGPRPYLALSACAAVALSLVFSIFVFQNFPTAFIEGQGLTPFKIGAEYAIIAALLIGFLQLYWLRENFDRSVYRLLTGFLAASIFAELVFTGYVTVDSWINMLGHFLKIFAFYFLYRAVVATGMQEPYRLIFREMKASEDALRLSEARLEEQVQARTRELADQRALLETILRDAASGIIVADTQGHITFANLSAQDFIRQANSSADGKFEWGKIITPEGRELSPNEWLLPRAIQGETVLDLELRLLHPDGTYSDLIASASPLHREDGSLSGTVVVLSDITQRRKAEESLRLLNVELEQRVENRTSQLEVELDQRRRIESELRFSQARLRRLADSNIAGIVTIHQDGAILAANDAFLELVGYQPQELTAHAIRWDTLTPPEYWQQDQQAYQQAQEMGECTPYEKQLLHKDGQRIPILTAFAALEEEPQQFIAYVIDISAQKRAEDAMQRYAMQLERSNRELQDFAYVASHDLQEPLRKIIAFGSRLVDTAGSRLDETEQDYLQRMQRAAERMRGMIDALLNLSRVTTQARPFSPVDLNGVMQGVLSDLELRIENNRAAVTVEPLPTLHADPLQMRQLLLNLISNAIKFSRPGVDPVVRISAEESGSGQQREICLHIEDNGIGIEQQHLTRIFQPFQRLHGKGIYEGNGMGLAIVQKIVERHGGRIDITSQPGEGSTFTVILPDHAPQDAVQEAA